MNITGTIDQVLSLLPGRWPARTAILIFAGALVSGTAFAALAGTSSAATKAADPPSRATPARYGAGPGAPWTGPSGAWEGPSTRAGPRGMWGGTSSVWPGPAPGSPGRAEYFHVVSTNPAGPGAIIVTGVFSDGGIEHPGKSIDRAVFNGGSFRIDHSAGRPTARFNPETCVGTISQAGPFRVGDGTGRFAGIHASGTYQFNAIYPTGEPPPAASKTMTASPPVG